METATCCLSGGSRTAAQAGECGAAVREDLQPRDFLNLMQMQHRDLFWRFLLVIKTFIWVVLYVGLLVKKTIFCSFLRIKEFGELWNPNSQFHIPVVPLVSCVTFGNLFPSFCSVFLSVK